MSLNSAPLLPPPRRRRHRGRLRIPLHRGLVSKHLPAQPRSDRRCSRPNALQRACLLARHKDCHFQAVIYCSESGNDIYRDWHVVGDPLLGVGAGLVTSVPWYFPLTVVFSAFRLLLRRLMEKAFRIYCLGLFVLACTSPAGKGAPKRRSWNILIRNSR